MLYLLHFDRPFKHARHYLGWVADEAGLAARLARHRDGHGARLMKVITEAGIGFTVARLWPEGTRTQEAQMKKRGCGPEYCPLCGEESRRKWRDRGARRRAIKRAQA